MSEVHAVARVLEGERAEDVVREALRGLDGPRRRQTARRIYGVCVLRARLAYQCGRDDAASLVDAYRRFEEDGEPLPRAWPDDPLERMAVERSAPPFLVDELVRSLGLSGADAFLAASNEPGPTTLRANTWRITRDDLRRRLEDEGIHTHPISLVDTALVVNGHANLFGSAAWRGGLFEVQDASSQLCAQACGVSPDDVVVDYCAGRGGKTLALAAGRPKRLHVHDVDAAALADLRPRAARGHVAAATTLVEGLPPAGTASVVLVDAPCSSLGPLRRSPDLRWRITPDELRAFPALQRRILDDALPLLAPGGRLIHATCTVRREENDDVVAALLRDHRDLELVHTRLLLPSQEGCDGFFFTVLRRS
jgi:16S rRNA (cytosine967-C5)-methyltransferase